MLDVSRFVATNYLTLVQLELQPQTCGAILKMFLFFLNIQENHYSGGFFSRPLFLLFSTKTYTNYVYVCMYDIVNNHRRQGKEWQTSGIKSPFFWSRKAPSVLELSTARAHSLQQESTGTIWTDQYY